MKIGRHIGIALLGSALLLHVLCAAEIKPGEHFKSPDGRFIAECNGGGVLPAVDKITIVDSKTGEIYSSIEVDPPLYSLAWTGDSETIVVVTHIAGGTVAGTVHLHHGRWNVNSADPREGDKYRVVRETLRKHSIELTYQVTEIPSSAERSGQVYLYKFVFDPGTTRHAEEERKKIDSGANRGLQPQVKLDYSKL
jgi:hypothetical protein